MVGTSAIDWPAARHSAVRLRKRLTLVMVSTDFDERGVKVAAFRIS